MRLMKRPAFHLPLALFASFSLAVILIQCSSLAPLNLVYRGEPLLLQGVQIQSLRDLVYSSLQYRRYFDLLDMTASCGKAFPAADLLEAAAGGREFDHERCKSIFFALGVDPETETMKYRRSDEWPEPDLLRFIGSGSYTFPFPDPYRLPFVDLKPGADVKAVFPELDVSLRGSFGSKRVEGAVLADLPVLEPEFANLPRLSLGLLARARQEARRVAQADATYLHGVLLMIFSGLALFGLISFCMGIDGMVGKVATGVAAAIVALALLLFIAAPSFNRTRRVELDFQKLSPADLVELKQEAKQALELLAQKELLATGRVSLDQVRILIDAPPIVLAPGR